MKGEHRVIISAKRIKYDFVLRRNITIIRGDSATGKTTMIDMIREFVNNPSGSPVEVVCDKKCYVLDGSLWKQQLSGIMDSIVFIDEGNEFVRSTEFAETISKTDNYYVIVTREALPALPYSAEEIYGIRESGKYGTLKQKYNELYRIYGVERYDHKIEPEIVLTEDSNSGYQFFNHVCTKHNIKCESMGGKSNVFHYLKKYIDKKILIIADGAAFGSEMDRIMQIIQSRKNIALYLPESFEWLVLSSGILNSNHVIKILDNPAEYVESKIYFSWERFFTAVLIEETRGTYLEYSKKKLNPAYLENGVEKVILQSVDEIINREYEW